MRLSVSNVISLTDADVKQLINTMKFLEGTTYKQKSRIRKDIRISFETILSLVKYHNDPTFSRQYGRGKEDNRKR